MARMKKTVHLRIRTSFNGMQIGDDAVVELNATVQGWLNAGVAEVIEDGEDQARPGGAEPDDDERLAAGAARGVASGGEPGQGFGAGSYGTSA